MLDLAKLPFSLAPEYPEDCAMQPNPQADMIPETSPSVEAVLTHMLDDLPDGVLLLDENWRITYANRAACRMSRITPEYFNSKTLWELFPGVPGTPLEQLCRDARDSRTAGVLDAYFYEPFSIWVEIHVIVSGRSLVLYYRDVTAAHASEQARQATAERLEQVLGATTDGIFYLDRDYRITYMNPRGLEITAPISDALGAILWNKFPATVYPGSPFVEHYHRAMDERIASSFVAFYPAPLNIWIEVSAHPAQDATGIVIFFRDITEEKNKTEALQAQLKEIDLSRRELETIYQGSPIGMALYEPRELRLIRINECQAEIFRLPAAEAMGMRYEELTAGVSAAHALIGRAAAGETILNHNLEGCIARRPDEHRHWTINYSPIFAEDGTVQAVASATIETTLQKRAEAALIQSEKLAAVGRMASSIAHEINNPLEAVTNLIYITRQQATSSQMQEFLDLADQELRRVSIIVNQTLRFHKQSSFPREIACSELFSTVLSLYEGRLRNSSITVEKRKRAGHPIACFEGDIRQVLNNLVGNAIDAMPRGGRLLLRSRETTDWRPALDSGPARRGLALTIADTGSGMSAQTLARIFEPFFTTKGMNGTGLGLWISAEIVDRHHGRLALRSSQRAGRQGTVFSLFLPFKNALPQTCSPA
jgi:signal transduction histidine kinase